MAIKQNFDISEVEKELMSKLEELGLEVTIDREEEKEEIQKSKNNDGDTE